MIPIYNIIRIPNDRFTDFKIFDRYKKILNKTFNRLNNFKIRKLLRAKNIIFILKFNHH